MPTFTLSLGIVVAAVQNQVYALPPIRCLLYAEGGTWEQSADGTNFTAITLTNNQAELGGAFIRVTSAGPVDCKISKM
jgi:hypothetical protein